MEATGISHQSSVPLDVFSHVYISDLHPLSSAS